LGELGEVLTENADDNTEPS